MKSRHRERDVFSSVLVDIHIFFIVIYKKDIVVAAKLLQLLLLQIDERQDGFYNPLRGGLLVIQLAIDF